METKTQTDQLYFNSAEHPLSQFIVYDDGEVIAAPGMPTEADLRRQAIKYIGRNALPTMGRLTAHLGGAVVHGVARSIEHIQEQN